MYTWNEFQNKFLPKDKWWSINTDAGIEIIPGVSDADGGCKTYTLGHSGNAHCIITTGKSNEDKLNFIYNLITNACCKHSPEDLILGLIQCKGLSDGLSVVLPHITYSAFGSYASKAALRQLVSTARQRYGELQRLGYKDVLEYNKSMRESQLNLITMPRMLVIVDSADVLFERMSEDVLYNLSYLEKIGRIVGIHIAYVFDSLEAIASEEKSKCLLDQCSLRFTLDGDSCVQSRGCEDETLVSCHMPYVDIVDVSEAFDYMCKISKALCDAED